MVIHYNNEEGNKTRVDAKPMTTQEDEQAIAILNELLGDREEPLLQRLIDNYQNLQHYAAYTSGLQVYEKGGERFELNYGK